ncbi:MAG: ribonuclease HI [Candidatus Kaistia colombiensis]|nr:MAG: ribonuclease HI [Kaistia sp.]
MHIIDTTTNPTNTDHNRITVHTDGACSGNPGPGGWAAIIIDCCDGIEAPRQDISGGEREPTTNNRMELMAAIKALGWIKGRSDFSAAVPIHLRSDSQYVVNGMNVWLAKWLANGWRGSDKRPVKNQDLWTELHGLAGEMDVTWQWVRGHSGDPFNEAVDALAVAAIPKDEARRAA